MKPKQMLVSLFSRERQCGWCKRLCPFSLPTPGWVKTARRLVGDFIRDIGRAALVWYLLPQISPMLKVTFLTACAVIVLVDVLRMGCAYTRR